MQVLVRDNNVDQALKALKKKMQREGIFREMKLRGHYEKPSEKKAREKAEAVRRARKLARKKHAARRPHSDEAEDPGGRTRRRARQPRRAGRWPRRGPRRLRRLRLAVADLAAAAVSVVNTLFLLFFPWRGPPFGGPRFGFWNPVSSNVRRIRLGEQRGRDLAATAWIDRIQMTDDAAQLRSLTALAALLAGAALAGCQTVTGSPTTEIEDNQFAASPANIASLSGVVQRNPNDPQAYNMRGSCSARPGATTRRWPISTRRSASIRTMPRPTPIAA